MKRKRRAKEEVYFSDHCNFPLPGSLTPNLPPVSRRGVPQSLEPTLGAPLRDQRQYRFDAK